MADLGIDTISKKLGNLRVDILGGEEGNHNEGSAVGLSDSDKGIQTTCSVCAKILGAK